MDNNIRMKETAYKRTHQNLPWQERWNEWKSFMGKNSWLKQCIDDTQILKQQCFWRIFSLLMEQKSKQLCCRCNKLIILFSQTNDEIYPIKNSQYAIYCNQEYEPTFGGGHDICVQLNNFQDGYSNLGHSYQWDKYPGKASAYLFGSEKPNLIEIEVYEVVMKA